MSSVFESGEERERERHEVERYSSSSSFFLNIKKNERNAVKCYINDDNNSEYRRGQLLFITFKTVFRFSGCSETLENRFFVYYLKQRDTLKNNKEQKKGASAVGTFRPSLGGWSSRRQAQRDPNHPFTITFAVVFFRFFRFITRNACRRL